MGSIRCAAMLCIMVQGGCFVCADLGLGRLKGFVKGSDARVSPPIIRNYTLAKAYGSGPKDDYVPHVFSPNAAWLVVPTKRGPELFDLSTGTPKMHHKFNESDLLRDHRVDSFTFSPDSSLLSIAIEHHGDISFFVYRLKGNQSDSPTALYTLGPLFDPGQQDRGPVVTLSFAPDNKWCVIKTDQNDDDDEGEGGESEKQSGFDWKLYGIEGGSYGHEPSLQLEGKNSPTEFVFSGDSAWAAAGEKVYDLESGHKPSQIENFPAANVTDLKSVSFSGDGKWLFLLLPSPNYDGTCVTEVYALGRGKKPTLSLELRNDCQTAIYGYGPAISPDSKLLANVHPSGCKVGIYMLQEENPPWWLHSQDLNGNRVFFSQDSRSIAVGCQEHTVQIFDVDLGKGPKLRRTIHLPSLPLREGADVNIFLRAFSTDLQWLYARTDYQDEDRESLCFLPNTGPAVWVSGKLPSVVTGVMSTGGAPWFAFRDENDRVRLYDLQSHSSFTNVMV